MCSLCHPGFFVPQGKMQSPGGAYPDALQVDKVLTNSFKNGLFNQVADLSYPTFHRLEKGDV
jgi:hypothetical protein